MALKRLSDKTKKNLLDLEYNKHLQYYNTSIILLFTYIIGISIAFITKQIDYRNPRQLVMVAIVSMRMLWSRVRTLFFTGYARRCNVWRISFGLKICDF